MMRTLSPAMRHQARVLAQQAAGNSAPGTVTTGSQYELMLYQLAEDRRRLKQIQSIKSKITLKATLLPNYQEWIDGVLTAGKGGQDDVLTTILVWSIDTGDFERAIQIAGYAVQHKMTLPDQYERDIATMLLDEFSGAYLNGKLADDPLRAVQILSQVNALTDGHDTPDQARAKLHKALAYAQLAVIGEDEKSDLVGTDLAAARAAYDNLQRALTLYEGVGVKKDIERLERRLKKAAST
ncbi:phage terminase small subunit [Solimicrobium silvestre]|uniref:Phage small terminase subunit n=1 Tax=Solimicrobium silvestre TaxID=2099400 RepID=A0A2S9GT44_9BURK|nr:phage terminase small subunit [Solimicrobium silvestre]PRC90866.1 Phage small terminase subunit [Solimicrobium silvestre]